jgi:hypothetical protein
MTTPGHRETISYERAAALFAELAARKDIAFRFLWDGCYARAHLMVQHIMESGLSCRKAWTFAPRPQDDPLWVSLPNMSGGRVEWKYHVAPVLSVRLSDSQVRDLVLHPSMFDRPVTVEEWRDAQHDTPEVKLTEPGEPPQPERGGSGYVPGLDPIQGFDAHARQTMDTYLEWETERTEPDNG